MKTRAAPRIRDILTCGGLTLDTIFRVSRIPPVHFEAEVISCTRSYGGRAPNVAYMGAKLGLRTGVVSPVGQDFESSGYRSHLMKAQVDLTGVVRVSRQPTTRIYLFDDGTGRAITFFRLGASKAFRTMKVHRSLFSQYSVVHISSSGSNAFNIRAATLAQNAGCLVSFDPGNDPAIEDAQYVQHMLRMTSFLFANRKELPFLLKSSNASDPRDLLLEHVSTVAVIDKLNLRADVHTRVGSYRTPTVRTKIVDLTGASDGFASGYLFGYLRGYDSETASRIGIAVMTGVVERSGSQTGVPAPVALKRRYQRLFGQPFPIGLPRRKPNR